MKIKFISSVAVSIILALSSCGERQTEVVDHSEKESRKVSSSIEATAPLPAESRSDESQDKPIVRAGSEIDQPHLKDSNAASADFVILTDENKGRFKIEEGAEGPRLGDPIYSISAVPSETCGEYWVFTSDGVVNKLSVCTGEHAGSH